MVVLTLNEHSYIGDLVLQWMSSHDVTPKEIRSSNSNSALSGMVIAGLGVANLPIHFLPLTLRSNLRVLDSVPPLPAISYRAMYREDGPVVLCGKVAEIAAACSNFFPDDVESKSIAATQLNA